MKQCQICGCSCHCGLNTSCMCECPRCVHDDQSSSDETTGDEAGKDQKEKENDKTVSKRKSRSKA